MADKDINIKITTSADTAGADKAVEAVKETTEATKELTAAEADRQKRKEEYEARLAANRAGGTNTAGGGGSSANPMTDGSQLAAGPPPEAVRESTEAIVEQVEALEELTDAEAGVIDATKKLDDTAENAKGFKSLFDQQRLQGIGRELEKLGSTVGGLVQEFAKTEAGQEFFGSLSEEARTFGGVALKTVSSVAQGFAAGGPIGAAIAGVNSLLQDVGGSFIAVAQAEEEATRSLAAEQDRLTKQTRERQAIAADRAVEDSFRRESEWIEDQNQALEGQLKILSARREFKKEERDLQDKIDVAGGMSEEQVRIRRIGQEAVVEREEIQKKEFLAREAALKQELVVEAKNRQTVATGKKEGGLGSDEYRREYQNLQEERDKLQDLQNEANDAAKVRDYELEGLDRRTAGRYMDEAGRSRTDATSDTERRARERQAAEERSRQQDRRAATRRAGLGKEGEGIADQAAGTKGVTASQAAALEKMGDRLGNTPSADAADILGKSLEKLAATLTGKDDATARKFRALAQKMDAIEAQLKKDRTPS